MKVYTVITVATQEDGGNALDVSKTAYTTREAAAKGLEDYEEVQTNLFQKANEDGLTFTVLIVEQEVV